MTATIRPGPLRADAVAELVAERLAPIPSRRSSRPARDHRRQPAADPAAADRARRRRRPARHRRRRDGPRDRLARDRLDGAAAPRPPARRPRRGARRGGAGGGREPPGGRRPGRPDEATSAARRRPGARRDRAASRRWTSSTRSCATRSCSSSCRWSASRPRRSGADPGRSGGDPGRVAAQLLLAPARGDAVVALERRAAGEGAIQRGATDGAIAYLRRALAKPARAQDRSAARARPASSREVVAERVEVDRAAELVGALVEHGEAVPAVGEEVVHRHAVATPFGSIGTPLTAIAADALAVGAGSRYVVVKPFETCRIRVSVAASGRTAARAAGRSVAGQRLRDDACCANGWTVNASL